MQHKKALVLQRKAHEIKSYSDKVERLKKRGVEMITMEQCRIKKTFAPLLSLFETKKRRPKDKSFLP
jgi:hypothetical protein